MTHQGYFLEPETFEKLQAISTQLHSGSDAMRDEGAKLLCALDRMYKVELWFNQERWENGWESQTQT